ncbi:MULTISPECIES: antitoxin [unclassified Leifsonia]|uniref:antitoxin n=1 Tax=unclassified Leifsonia TaxID=2663824 RepID=UPI0006F27BAE|nr:MULTISPECIES: antitoxin [unclassified Leifsonia]KQX08194.1 antitoxin protein [Leifsonia sp. Root1293]KRA12476.1 antitoxin protein [Leifsonia sp. Root60]
MADQGGLGDKAKDFANSDQGEKASDAGLDKAGDAADSATGGKFSDKIDAGQQAADDKVGE